MGTKIKLLMWLVLIIGATNAWATVYEVGPGDYFGHYSLDDYNTLFMTGGTIGGLSIGDYAVANIYNTDMLGGISNITLHAYCTLNLQGGNVGSIESTDETNIYIRGGGIDYLAMHGPSTSYLYGGQIGTLASDQPAIMWDWGTPLVWIHIFCREYDYDTETRILTGIWEDYSDFNIQLQNIGAYPTYDLIEFHIVPEPVSLILLGLGGIWLKRRSF